MVSAGDYSTSLDIRWAVDKWMLLRLSDFGTSLSFASGESIGREGDPGDGLYVILISLLLDEPRSATVVASTPLRCVKLTRRQLLELENREPQLAVRVYRLVAQSLARSLVAGPP